MAATGEAADAGYVNDLAVKINASLGTKAKKTDVDTALAGKMAKPTGSGLKVVDAATGAWVDAPSGAGSTLALTWDHAALVWRAPDGSAVTATTHPTWADYASITADASSAVTASEVDLSVLPDGVTPIMSMAVASTADPITTVAAAAPTVTYAELKVV